MNEAYVSLLVQGGERGLNGSVTTCDGLQCGKLFYTLAP